MTMSLRAVPSTSRYAKLELGAGEHPSFGGFLHNDIIEYPHIELVCDCRVLESVADNSVSILRAIHLIEHFTLLDAAYALGEWVRVLCPGGVVELACPDLQKLATMSLVGNINHKAFLRDVYGLAEPAHQKRVQWNNALRTLSGGWKRGTSQARRWNNTLGWIYRWVPYEQRAKDNPNAHRWGYCAASLHRLMEVERLEQIVVYQQETALHGWGVKP